MEKHQRTLEEHLLVDEKELEKFQQAAIKACKIGGVIQLEHFNKLTTGPRLKFNDDVVTEVDEKAEKAVTDLLLGEFPDHCVLGEEGGNFGKNGSKYRWIIDPLDGTMNYSRGVPYFCISIALEINKKIVVGAVYKPCGNELFSASRGRGAFMNGDRIYVSEMQPMKKCICVYCTSHHTSLPALEYGKKLVGTFYSKAKTTRIRGSALDLCYVAAGRFDSATATCWEYWDWAGASVIVEEAGGIITDLKGDALNPDSKEICASNGKIHAEVLREIANVK
ncbi:Fructose-1,6-bisphosphatase/inositol-1-monophosphatase [Candidatus Gugararchaeum adminiculabundum]|nr:Fructose-1,6-bisphosphatase/inositol-1-monophosphatase [Candidatus Gugararchaeum adminiculabundum]